MENKLEVLAVLLTNRCNLKCIYCGRNENKEADKLATQALEGKRIYSKMQLL